MTAHETTPSDAAIGQAFREVRPGLKDALTFLREVERRAREIEQGRGALPELPEPIGYSGTQKERVFTETQLLTYGEACRRMGNRDE